MMKVASKWQKVLKFSRENFFLTCFVSLWIPQRCGFIIPIYKLWMRSFWKKHCNLWKGLSNVMSYVQFKGHLTLNSKVLVVEDLIWFYLIIDQSFDHLIFSSQFQMENVNPLAIYMLQNIFNGILGLAFVCWQNFASFTMVLLSMTWQHGKKEIQMRNFSK